MASIFMRSTSIAAALLFASMANAATPVAPTPAFKPIAPIAPPIANVITATPSNANISIVQAELAADKSIKVSVLASAPSSCDSMALDIDGKQKVLTGIKFPLVDYLVPISDGIYPANKGAHTVTVSGASQYCKGSANTKFSNVDSVPKIYGLTIAKAEVVEGQPLDLTVQGSGGACNYHLSIVNTDTQQEWKSPRTSKFPAFDKIAFDLPSPNYPHGNYKIIALASSNDNGTEKPCQGGSNTVAFKKTRQAIALAADTPTIKEVQIQQGNKMGGTDRFRNDEKLNFAVFGNVENSDVNSAQKRCQWTAKLVDSKGLAKLVGNGFSFNVYRPYGAALTSYVTGNYTLQISPTPVADPTDTKPCMGSAAKKIEIFGAPGTIKGMRLSTFAGGTGVNPLTQENSLLIEAIIVGPNCNYKITQKAKGKSNVSPPRMFNPAMGNMSNAPYIQKYYDDVTEVEVTIDGISSDPHAKFEGGSCEGSVTGSITVFDNKKSPDKTF